MKTTIEMAREASGDDWGLFQEYMPEIHRFAELVRADERAKMATDKSKKAMKLALEALEANQPVNYCMNNNGEKFPMMQQDPFKFERNSKAITALREALAAPVQQSAERVEPVGCEGAIVNGRVYADRLEHDYKFECEAGPLHLCTDWVEFRRCFEWLAQHTSPPAQSKPLTDEWRPSETGPQDGTPCLVYWGQSFGVPLIGVARRISPYRGEMLWHGHGGSHNEVTHWMPLPDAPIEAAHNIKEKNGIKENT